MRLNKLIAERLGLARRKADALIEHGQVTINGQTASLGQQVSASDEIAVNGKPLPAADNTKLLIALNKPVGYVCSRKGQGGDKTVYELLPQEFQHLNLVGRLDKDSSGLVLLTNDGELANQLSHPRYGKAKVYEVTLNKALLYDDEQDIQQGVQLEDGPSKLALKNLDQAGHRWQITMQEGRNRQIRRTFAACGYTVKALNRTALGPYNLSGLSVGNYIKLA